ncbi:3-oxoacyl-[acyl-carrier-protein] synthase III C-terminal domain-containing protein [Leifsonia sp. H3M29-4]|uniref:3-oxoacyl-ACP synthase III family protein n=1 Tax=Salinibacterium metalliresistens TaxID=3031321 RepID=UPI0023DC0106|nr:3-oxoacyl-[acyl-carrier-protein] synthase III C-terminal domain-containing protein [Salinibacterium metalliresistens]MDF1478036.1 3-oxoacyl-[acyl-carrier-protein] synthase III C-terminal domain-containing protein [Salinibacterium metalliresistens]
MHSASTRIAGLGVYLPERTRTTVQTERDLRTSNPRLKLATGLIHRLTGVDSVHVRPEGWQTSDLAVAAARLALEESPGAPDLLIFASASQDLIEPATSHIVAAKLGFECPVMDIKNACNSVINAMQVAEALIGSGQYRRVLIASGEQPSHGVRWSLRDHEQFIRSFPGYTMSDGGAAVILEATDDAGIGILDSSFVAVSKHWHIGTLPTGGSMNPRSIEHAYFDMDGHGLQQAFLELGPEPVLALLEKNGLSWDDFDLVAIHQVALPYLPPIFERLGVADDKSVITIADHGNLASVTLPLQLVRARERGMVAPGSLVLLIGLAGGISLGLMVVRL